MKKARGFFAFIMLAVSMVFPLSASAATGLDEIQNYNITVAMRTDGTMDITYHIDWKVLNDSSEGPLEWVKIGIPNSHADSIKALSDTISKIKYLSDDGDYIRVDFDRKYYANEIVSFDFSIHQSYMYTLDYDANVCQFNFTPGWFDDIKVNAITIQWEKENVQSSSATSSDGDYLVWTSSLSEGKKYPISVTYQMGVFSTSDDQQYTDNDSDSMFAVVLILVIIIAVAFFIWIGKHYGGKGNGLRGNGYYGGFGTRAFIGHGGYRGCACVSSCACACACACAGGGRAGCSAKNFYGAVMQTEKLQEALQASKNQNQMKKNTYKD